MDEEIGLKLNLKERRETVAGLKDVRDELDKTGDEAERTGSRAEKAGGRWKKMGGAFGKAAGLAAVAGGAIVAGGALAGKALYGVGAKFDDMADTIRVGTGATGKQLDGLVASAKNVGRDVPVALAEIGPVVADLNTRLGLTGPTLEKVAKQTLQAGKMMGEAVDVNAMSGALTAFQIKGKGTSAALDDIYRISQATGVGMNELFTSVSKHGPALQQFGFGFRDSASWIGTLDKAGLDSNKTIATLSRAMVQFAEDGKDPQKALQGTIGEIDSLIKAGDQAGAINVAADIFGTRGAGQFVAAVKAGKVGMDGLMKSTGATNDTILGAADDTADFAEQWQIFKNRALIQIEPIATRVFTAIGDGMAYVNETVVPMVKGFVDSLEGKGVGDGIISKVTAIKDTVLPIVTDIVDGFMAKWDTIQPDLLEVWTAVQGIFSSAVSIIQSLWDRFGSTIVDTLSGTVASIITVVKGAFNIVAGIFKVVSSLLKGDWKGAWDGIKQILRGAVQVVIGTVERAWGLIKGVTKVLWSTITGIVGGAWDGIKSLVSKGVGKIVSLVGGIKGKISGTVSGMFDGIKSAFRGALNWIIDKWNGLSFTIPSVNIPGIGKIGGGVLSTPDIPRLAAGGIVQRRPGGILANIGEGRHDEAVVPMNGRRYLIDSTGVTPLPAPQGLSQRDMDARLDSDTSAHIEPGAAARMIVVRIPVVLDGRQVGEVVLDDLEARLARQ